jgi:hypothetical protein
MPAAITDPLANFWSKVQVGSADECWEWQAGKTTDGYGVFWMQRKPVYAHRHSFALHNPAAQAAVVMHSCDNKGCVNPAHLSAGNAYLNANDAADKGMTCFPYRDGKHVKLSDEQVLEARRLYEHDGLYQREIAARFGVSQQAIQLIVSGKRRQRAEANVIA